MDFFFFLKIAQSLKGKEWTQIEDHGTSMEFECGVLPRVWTEASREGPRQTPCLTGNTSSPDEIPETAKGKRSGSGPLRGLKQGCSPSLRGSRCCRGSHMRGDVLVTLGTIV